MNTTIEIKNTLEKLFNLQMYGIKLGLENIHKFLEYLDNPQKHLKCFHIAGSNGKGSTSSFIASILMEAKYKTGLYTSPHFVRFNERIRINGVEINDSYIVDFYEENENFINEHKLTFFEVTTALAFQYFYDHSVDFAVIETGLGGRLDATNVLNPLAAIITSVSLEHMNVLGDTVEKIAKEKAGIIKKDSKVFVSTLHDDALEVMRERCKNKECELFELSDFIIEREHHLELYTEELDIDKLDSPLKGRYQRLNAALASLAVYKTLEISNPHIFENGIKKVVENSGLQGRYEILNKSPKVILDSAHNPEGIENFLREFNKEKSKYKKRIALIAMMKDKSILEMMTLLKNSFDEFIITEVGIERSAKIEDLSLIAQKLNLSYKEESNSALYLQEFIKNSEKDNCLVVIGSMYLLGEIKKTLQETKK